jgi:ribosomal protein S18 acetylase RimI-like enzyme
MIRPATVSDAGLLAKLGAETFFETFISLHDEQDLRTYIARAYEESYVRSCLEDAAVKYFIAYADATPVGYIKLILGSGKDDSAQFGEIELEKIYVLAAYHDRKIGRDLMLQAMGTTTELGCKTLFLGVWQENKRALKFYEKAGFRQVGTRTFTLGNTVCDDFILARDCSTPPTRS